MKLSIIIPVYNAAQYIEECIASLLCQTITDYEIIIVDDRGSDDSVNRIERIASSHERGEIIKIVRMPENSGAWAARNSGMIVAQGDYIAFVDADDWCDSGMFDALYKKAKQYNADWSYSGAVKEIGLGLSLPLRQTSVPSGELTDASKRKFALESKALFWTGIYRRDFLRTNDILFPNSKFSEDSYFVWKVMFLAKNVAVDKNNYYHYRIVQNSVSRKVDESKAIQKVNIFNTLINDLKSKGLYEKFEAEIEFMVIKKGYMIPLIIECINNPIDVETRVAEIKRQLYMYLPHCMSNKYLLRNRRFRWMIDCMLKHPKIASFFLRIKYKQDPF